MVRRYPFRQQKLRQSRGHKVPGTRDHDRVAIIFENMHQMLLEWCDVASPMKCDKRGFIKTDTAPRRQNLRRADSGNRLNLVLTSPFDALKKLESGKMK